MVLNDSQTNEGNVERSFIVNNGVMDTFTLQEIPEEAFDSDILLLGGTALVPQIHDNWDSVLRKAKQKRCITIVGIIYDYRNQKLRSNQLWPLGLPQRGVSLC